MIDFKDIKIYDKKTMADVFKEIHLSQKSKEEELKQLISDLKPYIKTAGDAVVVVPLITKYIEAGIKNDNNLIAMTGVIQRAMNNPKSSGDEVQLTEQEKEQLLNNIKELKIV